MIPFFFTDPIEVENDVQDAKEMAPIESSETKDVELTDDQAIEIDDSTEEAKDVKQSNSVEVAKTINDQNEEEPKKPDDFVREEASQKSETSTENVVEREPSKDTATPTVYDLLRKLISESQQVLCSSNFFVLYF